MKEFGNGLGLYWDVMQRSVNGVDYRVFAFDNAYQANLFAVAFDGMQFDTEKRPALRLEC